MENENLIDRVKSSLAAAGLFIAAVFIVYRGNSLSDPSGSAFIVPVMCSLTALAMAATGLTLALRAIPRSE